MHWRYSGGYSVYSVCVYSCLPLQLARRGLDVVIMSRSREKLDKVAEEISRSSLCTLVYKCVYRYFVFMFYVLAGAKYSEREVCVIPVDFSKGGEIYPDIAEELKDLDIGVLGMCMNA